MRTYLVSYDLKNPISLLGEPGLQESLKGVATYWWHHLPRVWLLAGEGLDAQKIDNRLAVHFARNPGAPTDSLLIIPVVTSDYHGFLPAEAWVWLERVHALEQQPVLFPGPPPR